MQAVDKSLKIANELIVRSANKGCLISNLSLQKLVYFAHGWHLALTDEALVDEEFEAWRFGPVLSSLYHKFKGFSSNPIPVQHPFSKLTSPLDSDCITSQLLDKFLDVYGKYTSHQLVILSHDPRGPWAEIWNDTTTGIIIPNQKIREYFCSLAAK